VVRRMSRAERIWRNVASWFYARWLQVKYFFTGKLLEAELESGAPTPERSEAELAIARVIDTTDIAPDCVSAGVVNGGAGIRVKHEDAIEWFVGRDYAHAADEAIAWLQLQGDLVKSAKASSMNRAQRRMFDARRKKAKKMNKRVTR
jgi:hypothetical protein